MSQKKEGALVHHYIFLSFLQEEQFLWIPDGSQDDTAHPKWDQLLMERICS